MGVRKGIFILDDDYDLAGVDGVSGPDLIKGSIRERVVELAALGFLAEQLQVIVLGPIGVYCGSGGHNERVLVR